MRTRNLLCFAVAVVSAAPLAAQDDQVTLFGTPYAVRPGDAPTDAYGAGVNTSVIQVSQWQEVQTGTTWEHPVPGLLNLLATNFAPNLYAPLELEAGVEVTQVCANVYDASTTAEVLLLVAAFESGAGTVAPVFRPFETVTTGAVPAPNYTLLCATVDPVIRIRTSADIDDINGAHTVQYWVGAIMPVGRTVGLGPAVVSWRRTLSPPPATATFTDVPTSHPFFRFVESLAASGITGGCASGIYCPDAPITRGQMAVFLSTALGLYWPN